MTNRHPGNATCRPHSTPASQSPEFDFLQPLRSQQYNRPPELVEVFDMFRPDDRGKMRTEFLKRHRLETGKEKKPKVDERERKIVVPKKTIYPVKYNIYK